MLKPLICTQMRALQDDLMLGISSKETETMSASIVGARASDDVQWYRCLSLQSTPYQADSCIAPRTH